ncbi:MAG: zinc-finger domain-containing protein [Alphaproteobacteria bacterium]|nr:zinc-finger domain-containing protein [Alphaproteobacteria bacterium]
MKPNSSDAIAVETRIVGCDGGEGAMGHPLVFLKIDGDKAAECPYCGCRFVLKEGASSAGGH